MSSRREHVNLSGCKCNLKRVREEERRRFNVAVTDKNALRLRPLVRLERYIKSIFLER